MKSNEIKDKMLVETIDSTLRSCNKIKGSKQGIICNPEIKKEGTLSKVLVLFDNETEPRYVPISRLKAKNP
jgi:hypothetical protein